MTCTIFIAYIPLYFHATCQKPVWPSLFSEWMNEWMKKIMTGFRVSRWPSLSNYPVVQMHGHGDNALLHSDPCISYFLHWSGRLDAAALCLRFFIINWTVVIAVRRPQIWRMQESRAKEVIYLRSFRVRLWSKLPPPIYDPQQPLKQQHVTKVCPCWPWRSRRISNPTARAVARIFFIPRWRKLRPKRPKSEARKAESGVAFLGTGQPAPSPPARGSRGACKLPQRGPRRSPGRHTVFTRFKCSEWPLQAVYVVLVKEEFSLCALCQGKSYEKQLRWLPRLPQLDAMALTVNFDTTNDTAATQRTRAILNAK